MKHATQLVLSHHDAASIIGDLRYDALADFLRELQMKIVIDAYMDEGRKRPQLAAKLRALAADLAKAAETTDEIWRLCEPHMKVKNQ
jgi:hypothetical protein